MRIAIFFPSDLVCKLFQEREDIYFFDEKGWHVFDGKVRATVSRRNSFSEQTQDYLVSPSEIIKKLRMYGPLWSRWVAQGDQLELLMRDALLDIYSLSGYLRHYDVRVAIFNTGVTHHIDTLICEQACFVSKIEQVFLYTNNIMLGRLLPLLQRNEIRDRRVLGADISLEKSNLYLDRYIKNKKQKKPPESGGGLPSKLKYGYWGALIKIALSFLRRCAKIILIPNKSNHSELFPDFAKYNKYFSGMDFFRQIRQQRAANKYYIQHLSSPAVGSAKSGIKLLFAAHYQPEATSFPEGGELHNSIDILIELRRRGYSDVVIYKEHPASLYYAFPIIDFTRIGMCRSVRYYAQLLRLGCVFIDHSFQLSVEGSENYWYLPLTITGSIAVERALMGFHTIVTGHPWFKDMPGVLNLSEIESLEVINPKWVLHDPDLAQKAYVYLNEILSGKTISNATGIGSGEISTDENVRTQFEHEFGALLSALSIKYAS
jgi:hypothetical protein